eukprot:scaffold159598_cov30-Tisochrysis_lutea.AAC.3
MLDRCAPVAHLVFEFAHNRRVSYIERVPGAPPPQLFKCHLQWSKESELIIGWADSIKVRASSRLPAFGAVRAGTSAVCLPPCFALPFEGQSVSRCERATLRPPCRHRADRRGPLTRWHK